VKNLANGSGLSVEISHIFQGYFIHMRQAPSDLVHGIYQSLVDGGTWPELLLGLADHVTPLETVHDVSAAELMDHFDRADALHVQMNSSTEPVQDTLRHTGPEICLIDHTGVVTHNTAGAVGAKIDRALRTYCLPAMSIWSWLLINLAPSMN
jgi:hypothetical protein